MKFPLKMKNCRNIRTGAEKKESSLAISSSTDTSILFLFQQNNFVAIQRKVPVHDSLICSKRNKLHSRRLIITIFIQFIINIMNVSQLTRIIRPQKLLLSPSSLWSKSILSRRFSKIDNFQILGIEKRFEVDQEQLKQRYKKLMTQLHPDKIQQTINDDSSPKSLEASDVTNAYQIVSHPQQRASHLLELFTGTQIDETTDVDHEFLMKIMEIRESIDEIEKDEKLRHFLNENNQKIKDTCVSLNIAFENKDFDKMKKLTVQLQYWYKVEETIIDKISILE